LEHLDRLYSIVRTKFGHLDIVLANAAVGFSAPIQSATEEQFDQQFDINVKGVFFTVQKALPLLRDGSSVILTSSGGARKGGAALSIYSATKAAVRSFARSWTTDLKDRKIRVNSLSPGPTDTPIFGKIGLTKDQIEQVHSHLAAQFLLVASRVRMKSPRLFSFWPPTRVRLSPVWICVWTGASHRFEFQRECVSPIPTAANSGRFYAKTARLLPPRNQVKPTGGFPLFEILAEERCQLVERNEAHAVVKVHVAGAGNNQQFLGFGSPLVGGHLTKRKF
jgi:hypothetical protein